MRYVRIVALIALCLAFAPAPALAVTGYDSAYSGESAFVMIDPGQTQSFQVFFSNTGTLSWIKGGDTQVDLAACLADKVTCPAQDPADSTWNSGWLSATRYATTTQGSVAPGTLATFAYNIKAPMDATGTHRFNGDLVVASSGARIHPQGYYQDATVNAVGSIAVPTPRPTPGSTPFPSAPPAPAPTPNPNPLLCFDGVTDTANGQTGGAVYGGLCTLTSNSSATLNNVAAGRDGTYSGVNYQTSSLAGKTLAQVMSLGFDYTGIPTAGSPRISLPTSLTDEGGNTIYAFISAFHCNDGAGRVDAINDATCTIFITGGPVSGYPNWAAFAAANPTVTVGTTPFVIADDVGAWTVSNVHLGG